MWNTTDYKGNPVTWYSQDEMDWLLKKLDDANKCLNDCELHWEKERKILKKEKAKYKQAIEQIRQIVEFAIEETLTLGQKNATDKILEIISEAESEEK